VPVWAAILVALASGGFGAWLAAWNDRHERFRDRMITAADDLVGAATEAINAARDAIYCVEHKLPPDEKVSIAWKKLDTVLLRRARVELLFGPTSDSGRRAKELTDQLSTAIDRAQPPNLDETTANARLREARTSLTSLQQTAFKDIRRAAPPSATIHESIRRVLERKS
jgi:hypothetical protein